MNKTQNYQLNQWEADDRVLRTDFNADNAKIDAALGAIPAAVLYRGKLTAAAASMTIDLSGRAPEKCIGFLLWVQLPAGNHSMTLSVDGGSEYYTHSSNSNSSMSKDECIAYFTGTEHGAAPVMSWITAGRTQNGAVRLSAFTPRIHADYAPSYGETHGLCSVPSLSNLRLFIKPNPYSSSDTVVPAGTEVAVIGFKI